MTRTPDTSLQKALEARFNDAPRLDGQSDGSEVLRSMIERGSCRAFRDQPVPPELIELICATALASPSKSDLQQRDIVVLKSAFQRAALAELVSGQTWVAEAPMLIVFCGNNRRQRQIHEWNDVPFANDHLDALFNAIADAAIALGAFVTAAEALGLGCCPISAIRNEATAVSDLLNLPSHVFPVAGLGVGYPAKPSILSKRLPLKTTVHVDQFSENGLRGAVEAYDADRATVQPYTKQRFPDQFGTASPYTWSQDKARQYSQPERADFGAYIRAQGFRLD